MLSTDQITKIIRTPDFAAGVAAKIVEAQFGPGEIAQPDHTIDDAYRAANQSARIAINQVLAALDGLER